MYSFWISMKHAIFKQKKKYWGGNTANSQHASSWPCIAKVLFVLVANGNCSTTDSHLFFFVFWGGRRVEGATNSQYIKTPLIRSQLLRFPSGYVIKSRVLYLFRFIIYFSLSLCVPLGCVSVRFYSVRYCSDLCLSSAMHLSVTCYTFCTYTVST